MIDAEQRAKDDAGAVGGYISTEDLAAMERRGLVDEANLEIFLTWWAFGGSQHGLTPMQAAEMPAAMRKDFSFMLEEINRERGRQEKREANRKALESKR